jgi:hypothetical protein
MLGELGRLRRYLTRIHGFVVQEWWIFGLWLSQRLIFLLLTWLVQRFEHPYYASGPVTIQSLLLPWGAWDGGAYHIISTQGYAHLTEAAYSPLYPALIWLTQFIPYSALWISSLADLAALYLLFDLLRRQYSLPFAHRAVMFLAWTPFAAIFAAAYSESLFLLWSIAVFWALQRERLLLAGLLVAAATLTRQYGILLCLTLLGPWSWRRIAALGIPVTALLTFWMFVSVQLHTPFAPFASVQGDYARRPSWPWTGILNTVAMNDGPRTFFLAQHTVTDLILVAVAIGLAVNLWRFGWRESLYVWGTMLVVLCLPISTNPHTNIDALASTPRYFTVLFPLVLPLARWASTPLRARVVMWPSLLGVIYLTIFLAAGIWIG